MANDPGGGEGGSTTTPKIVYAASVSTANNTTSASQSVSTRVTSRTQKKVTDTSGTSLVEADEAGFGLKRPYLDWRVYPASEEASPPVATTSATFVVLHTAATEPQHPNIRVRFKAVTGAGTSGEIRLRDRASGTVIAGPYVVGVATTVEDQLEGILISPSLSGAGAPMKVDIEARRTAGANSVAVLVIYAIGKGG